MATEQQPAGLRPEWREAARAIKAEFPRERSALLPLLHRIQAETGYLDDAVLAAVAEELGVPAQEVVSTVSFYTLFYRRPVGKKVLHVCTGLPCALAGADQLLAAFARELGIAPGQTTPDGEWTLLPAECLAACDKAPVGQVNLRYRGPVPPEAAARARGY
ncbi:MAG: NAD(P)H-dependent oxidoreductase subunit E, partial [Firmicutes bacterium]|nr:NAD(P)H-dependent oxidoreductase subunit E [Bacillota bacterium]